MDPFFFFFFFKNKQFSGKDSACNAGAAGVAGLIPRSGRSPGREHGNPLQYSCLENPMDRKAWQAIVHGVAKSQTGLKWLSKHVFPWWLSGKECAFQCRRCEFHPQCQEDPLELGNGYPLQYSYLENSMEPGGLQSKGLQSQTRLSESHTHTHTHTHT